MHETLSASSPSAADLLSAFARGLRAGLNSPFDLTSGLSWSQDPPDKARNLAFDRGANLGQLLVKPRFRRPRAAEGRARPLN